MTAPRLLHCGDTAISVDFGNVIDLDVNAGVQALDAALAANPFPGVIETVPTYRALMVHFDPATCRIEALSAHLLKLRAGLDISQRTPRRWRVPVAYGGEHGEDLTDMAVFCGLSIAQIVETHAAPVYTVMMIGFLPGFSYLGGLDARLARPRRDVPRARIPASSISIGGAQTAIGSVEGPSGWHLIGRTPALPFLPRRDPVFLFDAGDEICFHPISDREWHDLAGRSADGAAVVERLA
ncbi:5-oxoprolinase subunit PxpB [Mesorhizobium sp. 8]|uniref:5-oxoprolinase subunit PxpB n=1 Tax=Mesorhizobium sp. 8 TaxID=2584466 RepID=UPI0011225050|nr:5-oxoprolinase subunit PxpB [Mesorhizobium sp. 8]QDC00685.1 5-oxoprolinase subunit PxpB [Mesorhizobium sp. 8]